MHLGLDAIAHQPGIQITGYTPMTQTIGTVCRDVNLDEPVALQMIILCSGCTDNCIIRQYDDTIVAGTDADLILCTDHTVRLHTTEFGLLDDKLLVTVVEHTTQISYNHFLACGYVRRTAHDL